MLKKDDGKQDAKVEKIKFFSDMPIAADREQDVRFGHLGIADNLKEIILQCPSLLQLGYLEDGEVVRLQLSIYSRKNYKITKLP